METFIEWLTNLNWSALGTIIVTWLTANVGILFGLVVSLIKTRASKNMTEQQIASAQTETMAQLVALIKDLEAKVIKNMEEADKKKLAEISRQANARLQAIQEIATASEEADKKLEEPSVLETLDSQEE